MLKMILLGRSCARCEAISLKLLCNYHVIHRSTHTVVDLQAKPLEREVLNYIQTTCSHAKCLILVHLPLKKVNSF